MRLAGLPGDWVKLDTAYQALIERPDRFVALFLHDYKPTEPEGIVLIDTHSAKLGFLDSLDLYCGSFNPLTPAHRAIFTSIFGERKCFELSIQRFKKPTLELDAPWDPLDRYNTLGRRLSQFYGIGDVLVTNASLMLDKAGVMKPFRSVQWHIGNDVLNQMLDYYGLTGVQGIRASYCVYPRMDESGVRKTLFDLKNKPLNCFIGASIPEHLETSNSTKIRSTWTDDGTKPTPSGLFRPPALTATLKV